MRVANIAYRTIWATESGAVAIIDQTRLPHAFVTLHLNNLADVAHAIRTMQVRGAPLIGAAAAYGVALAMRQDASNAALDEAARLLIATRPTAVNLAWAVERMRKTLLAVLPQARAKAAWEEAAAVCNEDVKLNESIGEHGVNLIKAMHERKKTPVNVLTHCNAGWLATVDWGTALAPVYKAHDAGIPVHVWVDETRPRNQGASLTAWELGQHGVAHTVIVDNAGGHLMQHHMVDLVLVGSDRTTAQGDVCNKIGTYLKALAAFDNGVPFYAAVPSPTIDWSVTDGIREIDIEERAPEEITHMTGVTEGGEVQTVRITPANSPARNYGFDVTPARFVTGIITERGICRASREGLAARFSERAATTE